ncbi:MAG: hypothetical protein DYG94_12420 [Leptolyngbya sp. PLA3]|nr:MAG: hypothetical protein EDM82_12725 [Cyanobacteria bacterium CYA]MCE7969530.1 hypothetical protein [Leptolyngbya sp. PL-A3]
MHDLPCLKAVTERDVDLLLLEELEVNDDFARWFIAACGLESAASVLPDRIKHSVSHARLGESDLVLLYQTPDAKQAAILIENKIDAIQQPEQAMRYQIRGDCGISEGFWRMYRTCLVAPVRYLQSLDPTVAYDFHISYEMVRDWLLKEGDRRSRFRAHVLSEAIEQNRRGWQPIAHERTTAFWKAYWRMASEEYPALNMPEPGLVPENSKWFRFRPRLLPAGCRLLHKAPHGCVDLEFAGASDRIDELEQTHGRARPAESRFVKAGKAAALRIDVPVVDLHSRFESQQDSARQGMKAAMQLLSFVTSITPKSEGCCEW